MSECIKAHYLALIQRVSVESVSCFFCHVILLIGQKAASHCPSPHLNVCLYDKELYSAF